MDVTYPDTVCASNHEIFHPVKNLMSLENCRPYTGRRTTVKLKREGESLEKFNEERPLKGRPIVVTGSSSGIGAATCELLVREGREVIGVDRQSGSSGAWPTLLADLSDPESISQLVDRLPSEIGGLMNIAGVPGTAPARTVMAVNTLGVIRLSQQLASRIHSGGFVVNLSSAVADRWSSREARLREAVATVNTDELMNEFAAEIASGSYQFSKECVRVWTQLHAAELLSRQVRVNSVSPGPVQTPILQDFKIDHGVDKVEGAAQVVSRFGEPEDIAQVLVFLASQEGLWVNGTDIRVDGGLGAARFAGEQSESGAQHQEQVMRNE